MAIFFLNLLVFLQMNLKSEYSYQLGPIDLLSIPVNRYRSRLIVSNPDLSSISINRSLLVNFNRLID